MQSNSNAAAAGLSRCVAADVYGDVVDCDDGFGKRVRPNHIVVDVVIVMLLGVLMCVVLCVLSIAMMGVQITRSLSMCGWCGCDYCCTVCVCVCGCCWLCVVLMCLAICVLCVVVQLIMCAVAVVVLMMCMTMIAVHCVLCMRQHVDFMLALLHYVAECVIVGWGGLLLCMHVLAMMQSDVVLVMLQHVWMGV